MTLAIIALIWILLLPVTYFINKWVTMKMCKKWTRGDRILSVFMGLVGGPFALLVLLFILGGHICIETDWGQQEVKW